MYSERLATIRDTWTFHNGDRDVVRPVPSYFPEIEGVADINDTYPLLFSTWKAKNQFHSRYQVIEELQQACRHCLWINPIDAESRGIQNGDTLRVFNDRGEVQIMARVTSRIMPGVVSVPQGAWYDPETRDGATIGDPSVLDLGGCISVLTSSRPTPISKGNGVHSNLCKIEKA